ncbi:hypothetical protein ACFWY9_13095 [Amycolatopsis sp. NPDC059027]|uniref:hypothetical protein n=1 Tax=unclassified Amycolatopsis TaxID=2618356 RepID=UPI003672AE00
MGDRGKHEAAPADTGRAHEEPTPIYHAVTSAVRAGPDATTARDDGPADDRDGEH